MLTYSETYPDLFQMNASSLQNDPEKERALIERRKTEADESVADTITAINVNGPHYKVTSTYKVCKLSTTFEVTLHGNPVFYVGKSINMDQLIFKIHWFYGLRNEKPMYLNYIKANSDPIALTALHQLIANVKTMTRRSKEDLVHLKMEEAKKELISCMAKLNKKYRFSKQLMIKLSEDSVQEYCIQTVLDD